MTTTENITKEIERLIDTKAKRLVENDLIYKEKYEDLEYSLRALIQDAEHLKDDMTKNGLTFSSVEAEGYFRFALGVKSLLEE